MLFTLLRRGCKIKEVEVGKKEREREKSEKKSRVQEGAKETYVFLLRSH